MQHSFINVLLSNYLKENDREPESRKEGGSKRNGGRELARENGREEVRE